MFRVVSGGESGLQLQGRQLNDVELDILSELLLHLNGRGKCLYNVHYVSLKREIKYTVAY